MSFIRIFFFGIVLVLLCCFGVNGSRYEEKTVNCFIGIVAGNRQHYITGAEMECQGSCANVTLNMNDSPVSIFLCDPYKVCEEIGYMETCGYVTDGMTMCCCTDETFCNVRPSIAPDFLNQTFTPAPPKKNISCYAGVAINPTGFKLSIQGKSADSSTMFPEVVKPTNWYSGSYMDCSGECANLTLGEIGTLYLCDPIEVCSTLKMSNNCALIDTLIKGCCCSTSECNTGGSGDHTSKSTTVMTLITSTTPLNSSSRIRIHFFTFFITFILPLTSILTDFLM